MSAAGETAATQSGNRRAQWSDNRAEESHERRRLTGMNEDTPSVASIARGAFNGPTTINKKFIRHDEDATARPRTNSGLEKLAALRQRTNTAARDGQRNLGGGDVPTSTRLPPPGPTTAPVTHPSASRTSGSVLGARAKAMASKMSGGAPTGKTTASTGKTTTSSAAHTTTSSGQPEFMSRLSAFKAKWVEQGLATYGADDAVDDVLSTLTALAPEAADIDDEECVAIQPCRPSPSVVVVNAHG